MVDETKDSKRSPRVGSDPYGDPCEGGWVWSIIYGRLMVKQ